ncbi:hypothetical protein P025_gp44 [Pelagibacter phage HTVC025P]|jgi:hypothetical protein|uniref:Uncharacterized protein n=1 Tax=Pelagibacter phage HTVC025P TaxID=2259657 RepID=A0A4Y1NU48_9CAUD|nr:hypothetical protein P025_gp44 [Pelagibacter phage HTVC025P]
MAHFAKLEIGNIVERVEVVSNDIATTEQAGVDFLNNLYGTRDVWKQCSYNTFGGEHKSSGTPFRKNYPNIGDSYDENRNAFIPVKPFESWSLNETTCLWEAPVTYPTDGQSYEWNEETTTWDIVE